MKCWTGWLTSWNLDCQEKYQQQYVDESTLMAESEEELKSLLRVKEESEKEESKKADF